MANRIYNVENIFLQDWVDGKGDDKPIKIHPLTIKKFRRLADILDQSKADEPVEGEEKVERSFIDVILEATAFCMETFEPALGDIDLLGDHVDYPTMSHILEVAGGVTLGDPNQAAAAMGGKNS